MFRHEYRIRENTRFEDASFFTVEIKKWFSFSWETLEPSDYFFLSLDLGRYKIRSNFFFSFEDAEKFAREHAVLGNSAFVLCDMYKEPVYLGRLP